VSEERRTRKRTKVEEVYDFGFLRATPSLNVPLALTSQGNGIALGSQGVSTDAVLRLKEV
jgi:hypothetical protein